MTRTVLDSISDGPGLRTSKISVLSFSAVFKSLHVVAVTFPLVKLYQNDWTHYLVQICNTLCGGSDTAPFEFLNRVG